MPKLVVVLSGSVCSGKSTLATSLVKDYGNQLVHVKTHHCLRSIRPNIPMQRKVLQEFGEELDKDTGGAWVTTALQKVLHSLRAKDDAVVILDALRIPGQVASIRGHYGRAVLHIHLTAPLEVLSKRYGERPQGEIEELASYEEVLQSKTEREVDSLKDIADVVIETKRNTKPDVVTRAACHIGLYGRDYNRNVDVIVGGELGSEGKGQISAYMAPEYDYLVRVGGPNAGHTVYEEPAPFIFHHLPSGSRSNLKAQLVFGPGGVLNVEGILKEIKESGVSPERLSIDPKAMVISDEDIAKEKELVDAIGSTGQGVGQATARKILGRSGSTMLAGDIHPLQDFIKDTCRLLERAYTDGKKILLEGTQGTGLSLHHGSYPHVTSRDTTVAGTLSEAGISPSRVRKVVMVCRTYPIRVESPTTGDSGPMTQEITWEEIAARSGVPIDEVRSTEVTSTTKKKRRVGEFDWCLIRKAATLNAPTDIALTFADYIRVENQLARRFDQLTRDTILFIEELERVCAAPVSLISTRFHHRSIIDRRSW